MKTRLSLILSLIAIFMISAGNTTLLAQISQQRGKRAAVSFHFDVGKATDDPIALISASGEYSLFDRFSLGGGVAYLDGYAPLQKGSIEVYGKGYALNKPFDVFGQAGIAFYSGGNTPVFKGGVEWQTHGMLYLGANVGMLLETTHNGYMAGAFVGLRFLR
jgi:hypothetical protein